MTNEETIQAFIRAVEELVPVALQDPEDLSISNGNPVLQIIDAGGRTYGRLFGTDRLTQRNQGKVAWLMASQVWLTHIATGDYERLVYAETVNWADFRIPKSEFIGWEGGMPAVLADGSKIAIALSGMHGHTDRRVIRQAAAKVGITITEPRLGLP